MVKTNLKFFFKNETQNTEEELKDLEDFKVAQCRKFANQYMKLMSFLFSLIIAKRVIFDEKKEFSKLAFHLIVIGLFYIGIKLHSFNKVAVRIVPQMIAFLSYAGHTHFLSMNSVESRQIQSKDLACVDINDLIKHIVICGAFFINHIYIDIFLTVNQRDSVALNGITWGLFLYDAFSNPSLTINSKCSVLTLAIFALKFSYDAKYMKDHIYVNMQEKKKENQQWLSIFKKLPIGFAIAHQNKILFSNKKMHQIVGSDNINLEELDQSLLIQSNDERRNHHEKMGGESFQNLMNSTTFKKNNLKQVLGKVRKSYSMSLNQIEHMESMNSVNSENKFYHGDQTYTFLFHKVNILESEMVIIMFVDITQQEIVCKASLEQKYKNIFLSSVSHSIRTPLNILQLNNNTLRDLSRDNQYVMEILDQDNKTQELLNYQIADILDFSKLETNEFKATFTYFDVTALLQRLQNIFEPMAAQKKLFFNLTIDQNCPKFALQDESRLGQVLVNILNNAIKYTFKGTIKVIAELAQRNGLQLMTITIKDTGKGINNLEQIGKWFGNLNIIERVNQCGIGFGITISKKIINKLGGEIYFENSLGSDQLTCSGLTVTIEFPYQKVELELLNNIFNQSEVLKPQNYDMFPSIYLNKEEINDLGNSKLIEDIEHQVMPSIEDENPVEESIDMKVLKHTVKQAKTLLNKEDLFQYQISQPNSVRQRTSGYIVQSMTSLMIPMKSNKFGRSGKQGSYHSKQGSFRSKRGGETPDKKNNVQKIIKQQDIEDGLAFDNVKQECCNKILVVDDNPFNVKSIELMLIHCFGLGCDTAYSGQEAIKLAEDRLEKLHKFGCKDIYTLILTDINMPEMDGIQMTKKIRFLYDQNQNLTSQKCCIWAITAMNESEINDMIGNDVLDGISVKPMSHKQLSEILSKTLKLSNKGSLAL